ncbi:MAG: hypothetical protein V3R73_06325 [Sphingomonadales bacterium]
MKFRTLIKLAILSFFVGGVMVLFGITPLGFWNGFVGFLKWLWEFLTGLLDWGLIYIVTGAAVVVPFYLYRRFRKAQRRRRRSAPEE